MKGLAGTALHLWIVPTSGPAAGAPSCPFLNLELVPGSRLAQNSFQATVLLENPKGENPLYYQQLQLEVGKV